MGIKQDISSPSTSAPTLAPLDEPLALELEQIMLNDLGFLGHQLRHVPVAVDPPPAEPGPALAGEEGDGVACEGLGVAEEVWHELLAGHYADLSRGFGIPGLTVECRGHVSRQGGVNSTGVDRVRYDALQSVSKSCSS